MEIKVRRHHNKFVNQSDRSQAVYSKRSFFLVEQILIGTRFVLYSYFSPKTKHYDDVFVLSDSDAVTDALAPVDVVGLHCASHILNGNLTVWPWPRHQFFQGFSPGESSVGDSVSQLFLPNTATNARNMKCITSCAAKDSYSRENVRLLFLNSH